MYTYTRIQGFFWSLLYQNGMKMQTYTYFSASGFFQYQRLTEILQSQGKPLEVNQER